MPTCNASIARCSILEDRLGNLFDPITPHAARNGGMFALSL
jgi:hypothetical protein